MGKYEPLAEFLKDFDGDAWEASFSDIEDVLGFPLPPSAHEHRAWWANQYRGNHSQAKGWIEAGWETRSIDQHNERVRFERAQMRGRRSQSSTQKMWKQAALITGISNRLELEQKAVEALIQREAALSLIALGGSDPNAWAPERRRFD